MKKILTVLFFFVFSLPAAAQFSGDYNVGTGETYTTLKSFFDALNASTVAGDINVYITSDLTEAANVGLGVNTNGYSITIRPSADADRTITFTQTADNQSPTGHFVIGYVGSGLTSAWSDANTIATSNVNIDGFAAGGSTRRLIFKNTSANHVGARVIVVIGACNNTVIKNCIINNLTTSTTSPFCVGAVVRVGASEWAPSNLTIENNVLTATGNNVAMGSRLTNSGTPTSAKITGFVFKNNIVTSKRRLLEINYTNGAEISGNQFTTSAPSSAPGTISYGLWTSTGVTGTFNIFNNKFLASPCVETGAFGHRTVSLASGATYNIYNNMFSGMEKTSVSSVATNLTYLFFGGTGVIYNNTFYMPTLTNASSTGYYSSIQLSSANPEIKNNIFISDEANHTNPYFINNVTTVASDYNDFYISVVNNKHKYISSYTSFSAYQSANPTKDAHSKSVAVTFTSATDLSLAGGSIGDNNLVGTPLSSPYDKDIEGDSRNSTYPYMGADEKSTLIYPLAMHTVTMSASVNNATAFGNNGLLGTDGGAQFYAHWDASYLYLGWSGGRTNYSSDLFYAAIDTDPDGINGTSSAIDNVDFPSGSPSPDFYVVYENNSAYYGSPVTNGNAFEVYNVSGGNWNWVSRTDGNDNISSKIIFDDSNGEVRLRVAWSTLGVTPSASTKLGLVMWNNNGSANYMWARVPGDNPSNGSTPKTLTHGISFSSTGIGVNPSSSGSNYALPVELTSFTAVSKGNNVELQWKTATETNNAGFEVERRLGSEWVKVGFVEGAGTSNTIKEYRYSDVVKANGSIGYRLKQIDRTGAFTYSNVVEVVVAKGPESFTLGQNYPNPFNPTTTINFSVPQTEHATLKVFDITGKEVTTLFNETAQSGQTYNVQFNANGLASGMYLYVLQTPTNRVVKKMLLMK